jgi:hypothetical protein
MNVQEQKYKVGEKVVAIASPHVPMQIRRFVDRIYYCRLVSDPDSYDLVYFERELASYELETDNK